MLISDIPVGGPISIEISIDNVSYERPSSVVASKNGYILIAPFTSKGAVIDFSSYKDILFIERKRKQEKKAADNLPAAFLY